jgi:hypothetical protein
VKFMAVVVVAVALIPAVVRQSHAQSPPCPSAAPTAGDSPAQKGSKLRQNVLCQLMPVRQDFATARNAAHKANNANALLSALGGIATGVAAPKTAKWLGVGTAAIGAVIAFIAGRKTQDTQLVGCMNSIDLAVGVWDRVASPDDTAYSAFRSAIDTQVQKCPELGGLRAMLQLF